MKQSKTDRRVKYTNAMLRDALLKLLKDRPIAKITVTDVCRQADINRNTFYSHYTSVVELLRSIEDEVFEELQQTIGPKHTDASLESICRLIREDYSLYQILFSDNSDNVFLHRVLQAVYSSTMQHWRDTAKTIPSDEHLQLLYAYFINGGIAVIKRWIQSGMRMEPKEVSTLILKVSNMGLSAYT